jgi:hypothetical protein
MSNAAAIVEQTAEIFVSRARLMVPFLFWQTPRAATSWCSLAREAQIFGGILYCANPFLPPIRHNRMLRFAINQFKGSAVLAQTARTIRGGP